MYAFLSQPPPSKRAARRVPAPLSPSRANSKASISAWASTVYPGSPAPCSPSNSPRSPAALRRASVGRRPSLTHSYRRRPSIGQHTPSTAEYRPDLTAFGYTSLFAQFDKTPTTPSPFQQRNTDINAAKVVSPLTSHVFGSIPIPPVPQVRAATSASARRFRSFSILRSKKSKSNELPPTSPTKSQKSKGKKSTKPNAAPPSLANDLALMQFMGGGSVEDNVKKVMQARSKAVAKSANGKRVVEDVYRDEKGGIWYDKDEEMEYVHLLGFDGDDDDKGAWQDDELGEGTSPGLGNGIVVKASSPYTNAYCPLDVVTIHRTPTSSLRARSRPLLTLPSRPRRSHRASYSHLANPSSFINLEAIEPFLPRSPRTPKSPKSPHPPSPSVSFVVPSSGMTTTQTRKKKHRPRPAPLKLTSAQSAHARANAKVAIAAAAAKKNMSTVTIAAREGVKELSPASRALEKAKSEFVEDSFKPLPGVPGRGGAAAAAFTEGRKVFRVDVRGVFGFKD